MKKIIIFLFFFLLGTNICRADLAFKVNNFPVKVYVHNSSYSDLIKPAFNEWINVSNRKISVEYIPEIRKKAARISFRFVDKCSIPDKLGLAHTTYSGKYVVFTEIEIATTNPYTNERLSRDNIYKTIVHEIGHAIGLDHSPDKMSIMYAQNLYPSTIQTITTDDKAAIKKMYKY